MDYGVFRDAAPDWNMIRAALGSLVLFAVLVISAIVASGLNKRNARRLRLRETLYSDAKKGTRIKEGNASPVIFGLLAFLAFVGFASLLSIGFWKGRSPDCWTSPYAGNGIYKVVSATLVSEMSVLTDASGNLVKDKKKKFVYVPAKPKYVELQIEGRENPNHPSEIKIARCFKISPDRIVEHYTLLPKQPESGSYQVVLKSKDKNAPREAHIPLSLPQFAVKQDSAWRFVNEIPRQ